ncbi:MAG TPA: sialate O-acetylesterase [Verrucomicrobiae bacterium]|nr:sialate O-acetylesterase [Verrucomicrobiae bacterium]
MRASKLLLLSSCAVCLAVGYAPQAVAEVRLPHIFGSHMVLQQDQPLTFWGWAEPNETIAVTIGSETQKVQANDRGEWKAVLPAMKAGGPFVVTVSGSSTVRFEDVLVGEVWLCSGQSNMEMGIGQARDGKQEIAEANYPNIRLFKVPKRVAAQAEPDVEAEWKVCTPQTVSDGGWNGFTAAGYYFGRELHKQLQVPVGLVDSTWGGTRIEPWTPPAGFAAVPKLRSIYDQVELADPGSAEHQQRVEGVLNRTEEWIGATRQALAKKTAGPVMPTYPPELLPPHDPQNPTALYNGMIDGLRPFGIRGAIWYQGESNLGEGMMYAEKMKALVGGWRQVWGEGEFPFYFVQIAPYNYGGDAERMGEFWEAQASAAAEIPHCGMAVINDIGNLKDIHPTNKQEVGRRLALLALAHTYGHTDLVCSGPAFKSMTLEGNQLRVTFEHVAGGLRSRDGQPLSWFEVIDADQGGFVKADARIDGSSVVLSSPEVKRPVAMRFAWSMLAEPNLENSAGLPAGAFRAGTVPKRDLLALKVPEAKDYQLVYDLDLSKLGPEINYDANNCAKVQHGFDRIAYFLELQGADGNSEYVYVSMDAFTQDLTRIGVPTFQSGARFQQAVSNLDVFSNVPHIVCGEQLGGGNIEFWPDNYGPANSAHVPHASSQVYDFGDEPNDPRDGYGSMQVHNHDARQTLFALNHWREGERADLGIGNQPKDNPDWTFAANAANYAHKRLRVLVRLKP